MGRWVFERQRWSTLICALVLVACGHAEVGSARRPAPSAACTNCGSSVSAVPSGPPALAREACPELSEPTASEEQRETMFGVLSAEWQEAHCGLRPGDDVISGCRGLTLFRNGSYRWTSRFESKPAATQRWNFYARDENSGTLVLEGDEALLFTLAGNTLSTARLSLVRAAEVTGPGTLAALPTVAAPHLMSALAGTCWRRSNNFDRHAIAERLIYGRFGTVTAEFANGCRQSAAFGVQGWDLSLTPLDSDCADAEFLSIPQHGLEFIDDLLVSHRGTFRPLADPATDGVFLFDSWRTRGGMPFQPEGAVSGFGSARVTGRYEGSLTRGTATTVRFEVKNVAAIGVRLGLLALTLQAATRENDGFSRVGMPDYHRLVDFGDDRLDPGDSRYFEFELIPAVFGEYVHADFELTCRFFNADRCDSGAGFVMPIFEGAPVPLTPVPAVPSPPEPTSPTYSVCGKLATDADATWLSFSDDATRLAVVAPTPPDGATQVWDLAAQSLRYRTEPETTPGSVESSVFAGTLLARARRHAIELFDAEGALLGTLAHGVGGDQNFYRRLAVSEDTSLLAASRRWMIDIWSLAERARILEIPVGTGEHVLARGISSNETLATTEDGRVLLRNVRTGQILRELHDHTDRVVCADFGESARLLLTGAYDGTLILWNVDDGTIRQRLDTVEPVTSCARALDGTVIATDLMGRLLVFGPNESTARVFEDKFHRAATLSRDGALIAASAQRSAELYCRND